MLIDLPYPLQDTARTRYGIMKITKLDYKEEANVLLDLLNSPWAQ